MGDAVTNPHVVRSVATGGKPAAARLNAISLCQLELQADHGDGGDAVYVVECDHDEGCPCVGSEQVEIDACTCEIIDVAVTRISSGGKVVVAGPHGYTQEELRAAFDVVARAIRELGNLYARDEVPGRELGVDLPAEAVPALSMLAVAAGVTTNSDLGG